MEQLASVQRIIEVKKHPNADRLDLIKVLGWSCVAEKDLYKQDDMCIYVQIDSVIPVREDLEFLRKSCYKKLWDGFEGFKIRTVRLRSELSQGICFPLSILPDTVDKNSLKEGDDVTEILGVRKYEVPIPESMAGEIKGMFPSMIYKTDETRIQNEPRLLDEIRGLGYYASVKANGTSETCYFKDGEFGVCSRNLEYKDGDNLYWNLARKYDIEKKLRGYGKNIAIAGEAVGQGIQKNKLGLLECKLLVFNVWDIDKQRYLDYADFIEFCKRLELETVEVIEVGIFNFTLDELLEKAKGNYAGTENKREGIVIRPTTETYSESLRGRLSFKVLNNEYLEKED